jgi:hypothetical protein
MEPNEAVRGTMVTGQPMLGWGAVFAGWFVATAVAATLYAFGLAIGFSAFDPYGARANAGGIAAGAIAWIILTWGAAAFIGSLFASWFDGRNDTEMGVVRGLAVWGLSVTATGLLMARGATHLLYVAASPGPVAAGVDTAALTRYTARMLWIAFGGSVLALVAAVFGGWLGAHHVHRVYHLRTYQPHLRR